ncbi:MAG TPA: DUF3303 family protein [Terriglobales bacterium]|nr:DUF3303 family protein [Terriglobales bacterium]
MLFMVIERFTPENLKRVGERFQAKGRMMLEDVLYHASWLEPDGSRCFQVMEAPSRERLEAWADRWNDLMEVEILPVLTSADFWARRRGE